MADNHGRTNSDTTVKTIINAFQTEVEMLRIFKIKLYWFLGGEIYRSQILVIFRTSSTGLMRTDWLNCSPELVLISEIFFPF